MMFKNSLKLFCSNFDKVWKYLLYTIIVLGVTIGLMMPYLDVLKDVVSANWTDELLNQIPSTGLLYGSDVAALFGAIWDFILSCVVMLFSTYIGAGIYFAFLLLFFLPFLMNIGKYAVNEMLYRYMSSQTKMGFCHALVVTIGKSAVYSVFKTLYSLILKIAFAALFYAIASVGTGLFSYFLPVVVILSFSFVGALLQSFVSGWAPASVVCGFNIFKSFGIGISSVFRRYARVLSTAFILNMIFIFLVMGFGLVSAVILIPLYLGLNNMFEMVMFFGGQGMRYYIDGDTFLTPKKLEQMDNIQKTKYLL